MNNAARHLIHVVADNVLGTSGLFVGTFRGAAAGQFLSGESGLHGLEPQIYRQLNVELPAVPADLKSEADAERAAETIRKHLESREPEIER